MAHATLRAACAAVNVRGDGHSIIKQLRRVSPFLCGLRSWNKRQRSGDDAPTGSSGGGWPQLHALIMPSIHEALAEMRRDFGAIVPRILTAVEHTAHTLEGLLHMAQQVIDVSTSLQLQVQALVTSLRAHRSGATPTFVPFLVDVMVLQNKPAEHFAAYVLRWCCSRTSAASILSAHCGVLRFMAAQFVLHNRWHVTEQCSVAQTEYLQRQMRDFLTTKAEDSLPPLMLWTCNAWVCTRMSRVARELGPVFIHAVIMRQPVAAIQVAALRDGLDWVDNAWQTTQLNLEMPSSDQHFLFGVTCVHMTLAWSMMVHSALRRRDGACSKFELRCGEVMRVLQAFADLPWLNAARFSRLELLLAAQMQVLVIRGYHDVAHVLKEWGVHGQGMLIADEHGDTRCCIVHGMTLHLTSMSDRVKVSDAAPLHAQWTASVAANGSVTLCANARTLWAFATGQAPLRWRGDVPPIVLQQPHTPLIWCLSNTLSPRFTTALQFEAALAERQAAQRFGWRVDDVVVPWRERAGAQPFGSVVAASSVRTTAPALLWAPRLPAATLPQCRVMSLRVTFMTATQPLLLLRKEAAHTVRGVQSAPTLEWLHKVLPAREFTASDGGSDSDGGSGSGSGSGSDGGSSGNSGSDDDDDDDDDDSSASVGGWGQGDQRRERGCLLFGALWAQAQAQGACVDDDDVVTDTTMS